MDKYQYKSMLGGRNGRGARLSNVLLPGGGDPLLILAHDLGTRNQNHQRIINKLLMNWQ